ncbi:MAG: molybdate ABC transporter substrate-binding protein [Rickettsiales bacterium]|nr:molybdate ABC transporter substrate-binding protein [Rickettsiales bacterium]
MHHFRLAIIVLVVLFLSQLATKNVHAIPKKNLTIFAEPNLTLAMTELARIYSRQSNIVVSVNFNSSQELLDQIDQGDPADLFISAHKSAISEIKQKGLADYYNIGFFARDEIVLVGSQEKNIDISSDLDLDLYLKELSKNRSTVITDHDGSSSGSYTIDYLNRFKSGGLKVFNKVSEDETPILQLIKSNKSQYGLLFASQVYDDDLKVLAKSNEDDIFYQALVIVGYNMDNAREFLKFLKSNTAKTILRESGLIID